MFCSRPKSLIYQECSFFQQSIYAIFFWILLHTALRPSAPTNVMGSPLSTSVILTWSQSSMDVITGYTVSYTRTGGCSDAAPSGSETASGSPYTLSNLEENTPYQINIFARNSGGMSSGATYTATTQSTGE